MYVFSKQPVFVLYIILEIFLWQWHLTKSKQTFSFVYITFLVKIPLWKTLQSLTVGQKIQKFRPKSLFKRNQSISKIIFLYVFHFLKVFYGNSSNNHLCEFDFTSFLDLTFFFEPAFSLMFGHTFRWPSVIASRCSKLTRHQSSRTSVPKVII